MQINQETIPFSVGYYWVTDAGTGIWRVARKNHMCKGGTRRTEHYIMAGERFLDTGERTPDGVWATYKCCKECADARATSIYGDDAGVKEIVHWRPASRQPAVCGETAPKHYAQFPAFQSHVNCKECLRLLGSQSIKGVHDER